MEITPEDKKKTAREYAKRYRADNKDRIAKTLRDYYLKNIEAKKLYDKEYKQKNKKKRQELYQANKLIENARCREYAKTYKNVRKAKNVEYYQKNKEALQQKAKNYYHDNIEDSKIRQKSYKENNKEHLKEYKKRKYDTDSNYKLLTIIRARIRTALKYQGVRKDIHSKELLGESQEFVWKHLESKFKEGMTRENHGFRCWHIDHIKPMSSFDLRDPEEQKKCCHYTNLQPLWWWENLQKSNKYEG